MQALGIQLSDQGLNPGPPHWKRSLSHWTPQGSPRDQPLVLRFVVVQPLSPVRLFVIPGTAARQTSLSFTVSWSLLKLMSIELVMPSNHLILCRPLLLLPAIFPSTGSCPVSQLFASGGQTIGVSASASVLPMNIQG